VVIPLPLLDCSIYIQDQTANTPIIHSGNIALLPDATEPIPVRDRHSGELLKMEAYLVEAQTLEGLSGAPVFQREMVSLAKHFPLHNGGPSIVATGSQLLGVYSAAWDGEPSSAIATDRKFGPDKRVPIGVGIVVPAEKLLELIMDDPELKKKRVEVIAQKKRASAAVADSSLHASDANPNHREDFTSLLGAAAQKRESKD
jgi:hypothetical protein